MLVENQLVHRDRLRELAGDQYAWPGELDGCPVEFAPLGEDSWAYRIGPLWLSVRRDLDGHFPAAYAGACWLQSVGCDFVLAPVAGRDGAVVHTVDGFPVVVFPYLPHVAATPTGVANPHGPLPALIEGLERVHACSARADLPADLPEEDFTIPFDAELDAALARALDPATDVGPLSADLRGLLSAHRDQLGARRRELAATAHACARRWAAGSPRALTHGDPSRANVVLDPQLLILDWGGLMLAPPERDWSALHRAFDCPPRGHQPTLRFYALRWAMAEVAEYTARFVAPHTGDADDAAMWCRLQHYVRGTP